VQVKKKKRKSLKGKRGEEKEKNFLDLERP